MSLATGLFVLVCWFVVVVVVGAIVEEVCAVNLGDAYEDEETGRVRVNDLDYVRREPARFSHQASR